MYINALFEYFIETCFTDLLANSVRQLRYMCAIANMYNPCVMYVCIILTRVEQCYLNEMYWIHNKLLVKKSLESGNSSSRKFYCKNWCLIFLKKSVRNL